jgi:hypothetical protein
VKRNDLGFCLVFFSVLILAVAAMIFSATQPESTVEVSSRDMCKLTAIYENTDPKDC